MQHLSPQEIDKLINQIGAYTLVADATKSEVRVNPIDWATGSKSPSRKQMVKLCVLKEVMDIVIARIGQAKARQWLEGVSAPSASESPLQLIRNGKYEEVRRSAQNTS